MNIYEIISIIAGCCTTAAFVPQALKVLKSRSVNDISIGMYSIFCFGLLLWILYGIHLNSVAMIFSNIITFLLSAAILVMKLRWGNK